MLIGWIVQFVDDLMGLAAGPSFVVAEAAFLLGLRKAVEQALVARAGSTRIGEPKTSA